VTTLFIAYYEKMQYQTYIFASTLPGLLPEAERGVSWQDRSLLLHTQYGSREPTQALEKVQWVRRKKEGRARKKGKSDV